MQTRIIAKLDAKPPYIVKPVHFEGLRKVGTPQELAKKYYSQGADELIYIDIVASLYQREILYGEIEACANELFVPFGVGGGVRSIDDFSKLFHAGADKVIINTFALQNDPSIIDKAAQIFGAQAVCVNIEAKKWDGWYECYSDCGRIRSSKDVLEWAKEVESRGAGEIILQSIDKDGRGRGFDIELAATVVDGVGVPVVVASGAGDMSHIKELIEQVHPSGVALASTLHYDRFSIGELRAYLKAERVFA